MTITDEKAAAVVADVMKMLDLGDDVTNTFASLEWAEDEIKAAQRRHRAHSDRLFHSFRLLVPTLDGLATDFVYRSHCRELLDRVATGGDTRPGTAAEVCCAMMHVSLATPMRSTAVGLYMRMWLRAGFPEITELTESSEHHEALERAKIDEHEEFARRAASITTRVLGDIECAGRHHGVDVDCVYRRA